MIIEEILKVLNVHNFRQKMSWDKVLTIFFGKFPKFSEIKSLLTKLRPNNDVKNTKKNLPRHCLARLTKYHSAIEPLKAVIVLHITNKTFSLFDRCNIVGSNKYDNDGHVPNRLNFWISLFSGNWLISVNCERFIKK